MLVLEMYSQHSLFSAQEHRCYPHLIEKEVEAKAPFMNSL